MFVCAELECFKLCRYVMLCGTNNVWKLILGNKIGCPKSRCSRTCRKFHRLRHK